MIPWELRTDARSALATALLAPDGHHDPRHGFACITVYDVR
jgi:hypothetical protein